ncbi:3-oxoacyl-[acyl-carrier-protein] synthase III C-terminal domain-containing protein [Streptomyces sp. NPDC012623]|uniref:3-oxoacyl-[acyl-carrier-protein] synthase III C-terminal domain-containing protein n=1 Tax=unclassified Streptomyces TaxID=2593676 RepID=UPI003688F98C
MLWQDITIAGTGAWVPPIRPEYEHRPRGGPGAGPPSALALNGFTSAAVSKDDTATQMAARAGLKALRRADVASADLSLIAHAGFQDGDHYTPAAYLMRVLGGKDTAGIEIGAASDGGAAALVTAAEHLAARPHAKATLVTTGTRFPDERWGYARELGYVAGDAGAAAVLTRGTGFARLVATAHVTEPQLEAQTRAREGHTGAARRAPVEETGFMPHIDVLGRATHRCIRTVLDEAAVAPADISHVVPIAIGSIVLDLLLAGSPLGLRADDTSWTYGRHLGHAGPSDVLLALDRTFRSGALRAGEHVLVVSFGVGFRWTTALIEITRDPVAPAPAGRQ